MPEESCSLVTVPRASLYLGPRGRWLGWEVVVVSIMISLGYLLCHKSILSTALGIGTQWRQHCWSRASCHGNAEQRVLEVFLAGEVV